MISKVILFLAITSCILNLPLVTGQNRSHSRTILDPGPSCFKCKDSKTCLYADPPANTSCKMSIDYCMTMYIPYLEMAEKRCLCHAERECLEMAGVAFQVGKCTTTNEVNWAIFYACLKSPGLQISESIPTDKAIEDLSEQSKMKHVFCLCEGDFCNSNASYPYINGGRSVNGEGIWMICIIVVVEMFIREMS